MISEEKNNVQNFRRLLLAIDLKWNQCGKWVWKLLFAVWFICSSGSWKLCNFEQTDIKHIGEACSSWMHTTMQTRTSHFSNNSPTQEHQPHVMNPLLNSQYNVSIKMLTFPSMYPICHNPKESPIQMFPFSLKISSLSSLNS